MWTLYDPLDKRRERKGRSTEPGMSKSYLSGESQAPTTLQKMWFVMEPVSILRCRTGSAMSHH